MDALDGSGPSRELIVKPETLSALKIPTADRLFRVYCAVRQGLPLEEIGRAAGYDLWFLAQMKEMQNVERRVRNVEIGMRNADNEEARMQSAEFKILLREAKQLGFANSHIARLLNSHPSFLILHSLFSILHHPFVNCVNHWELYLCFSESILAPQNSKRRLPIFTALMKWTMNRVRPIKRRF